MSKFAIKIDGLSKRYFIRTASTSENMEVAFEIWLRRLISRGLHLVRRLLGRVKGPYPIAASNTREFWALKDLSLTVEHGEVLGILGPNGSGKSTMLKMLSQIVPPSEGHIELYGQVGSLLEVGTGFNPELSGHENIYLYGAILGMSREMIAERYDEIVEFSELQDFLHQPIKHYSSGMHAKLGFSVASHLDCDILLIDEILSVGDASFRRKSYRKMTQLITEGKTVLFVSHNMSAINNLCTRAIVLAEGKVVFEGDTNEAISHYLDAFGHRGEDPRSHQVTYEENPDKEMNILSIKVLNSIGEPSSQINYNETFTVEMEILIREPSEAYFAAVGLRDTAGSIIVFSTDEDLGPALLSKMPAGRYQLSVPFPARMFRPDSYRLMCMLAKKPGGQIERRDEAVELTIIDHESWRAQQDLYRKLSAIAPEFKWSIQKTGASTKQQENTI